MPQPYVLNQNGVNNEQIALLFNDTNTTFYISASNTVVATMGYVVRHTYDQRYILKKIKKKKN